METSIVDSIIRNMSGFSAQGLWFCVFRAEGVGLGCISERCYIES